MRKGRSEQREVYLYGDNTIKVDRDSAEVLPRGVPPPGTGDADLGSSPNLATDNTIYELCLPSECETRILRVEKIHSCGTGFELSAARALSSVLSVGVSMAVIVSKYEVGGMKIVLGLKQGTSAGEFEFRNHVVFGDEPAIACFEDFKLIEGLVLRVEPRNCLFRGFLKLFA